MQLNYQINLAENKLPNITTEQVAELTNYLNRVFSRGASFDIVITNIAENYLKVAADNWEVLAYIIYKLRVVVDETIRSCICTKVTFIPVGKVVLINLYYEGGNTT